MGDLREERLKLHELIISDNSPDPVATTTQYQKVQNLEGQRNRNCAQPEQREQLKSSVMTHGISRENMRSMHQGAGKD